MKSSLLSNIVYTTHLNINKIYCFRHINTYRKERICNWIYNLSPLGSLVWIPLSLVMAGIHYHLLGRLYKAFWHLTYYVEWATVRIVFATMPCFCVFFFIELEKDKNWNRLEAGPLIDNTTRNPCGSISFYPASWSAL